MRYVSINSVPNGSTGAVMQQVTEERRALGDECWCMWGRGRAAGNDYEFNFGTKPELYLDVLQTRIDGKAGFHSKRATRRLLNKLDEIQPDVVHLHNIHGYYVNIVMLFDWLAVHDNVQVMWTLHDCWAFTGHCAYFTYVGCRQWNDCCAYRDSCPQIHTYPKTFSKKSPEWNYVHKQSVFTRIPSDRLTLITPSHWLEGLVSESFLAKYPVVVRHNTVEKTIFKPTPSDFRERYGVGDRIMVLGVASPWTERKGLGDFVQLSKTLESDRFLVVLVGLSKKQIRSLPRTIIALERTESIQELAAIYTAADIFFNPTREDNYPTVNLEAEACGTPVITYDTGGCRETVALPESRVIKNYIDSIELIKAQRL